MRCRASPAIGAGPAAAANRRAINGDIASWTAPSDSDTSGSTSRISGHKRGHHNNPDAKPLTGETTMFPCSSFSLSDPDGISMPLGRGGAPLLVAIAYGSRAVCSNAESRDQGGLPCPTNGFMLDLKGKTDRETLGLRRAVTLRAQRETHPGHYVIPRSLLTLRIGQEYAMNIPCRTGGKVAPAIKNCIGRGDRSCKETVAYSPILKK
jgi:hypothetical protein